MTVALNSLFWEYENKYVKIIIMIVNVHKCFMDASFPQGSYLRKSIQQPRRVTILII